METFKQRYQTWTLQTSDDQLEKLALEENLEKTHELNLKKINKTKKKSHAQNIAREKTNDFVKKLKKLQRKIKIYGIDSVIPKKYIATTVVAILIIIICIIAVI